MSQKYCPDCGPTRVDHVFEKSGVLINYLGRPLQAVAAFFSWIIRPMLKRVGVGDYITFGCLWILSVVRIGSFTSTLDPRVGDRARVVWEEAVKRGIQMRMFLFLGHPTDLLIARYKRTLLVFDALPRPRGGTWGKADWMDEKPLMRKAMAKASVPIARGAKVFWWQKAKSLFGQFDRPVIIKPSEGSRSRHTTIHITTLDQLQKAFTIAKQLSPWVILEEELIGDVYRATVIGGKAAGVLRREPPQVIADGEHTIAQLVSKQNENPKRHGPVFHELVLDADAREELQRQGLTEQSIPQKGTRITLHQKVGRSQGAVNRDVTSFTHPDNVALFEQVGKVLNDPLVGIDFIIDDISKSWKTQKKAGVIECNSLPFIDLHHFPFSGEVRNTAGALWDIVLPETKQ